VDILSHWLEDQDGKVFGLQSPFSIGRASNNAYVVPGNDASRHHAMVQPRTAGEYWLSDLNSRNGVFLNGRPLQQSERLKPGDIFQVANCQFVFHARDDLLEVPAHPGDTTGVTMVQARTTTTWLLIIDIINSVQQAQAHTPNAWTAKVGAWIGECRSVVESHGGAINNFLGDGFMSFWSAERASASQVVTAVERLMALQATSSLPFRIIFHYGPVHFVGLSRGEISLTGTAVNFAFRLEKVANGLGKTICASKAAIDACEGLLAWENVGEHPIPSFAGTSELFSPKA
jgi:class 3 adenylate cyclase